MPVSLLRYNDVLPILEAAHAANGGMYKCESRGHAYRALQRCNILRRAIRANDPDGICIYDRFIITVTENYLIIKLRTPFRPENFHPLPQIAPTRQAEPSLGLLDEE